VQLIVNERRAARNLPPYPYSPAFVADASTEALFAAVEAVHAAHGKQVGK